MNTIMKKSEKKINKNFKVSLKYTYRKKNYKKINNENKSLLERLKNKQPNYNRKTWAVERKTIEDRIGRISHFPKTKNWSKTRTKKVKAVVDIRKIVYNAKVYVKNRELLIEVYKYPTTVIIIAIDVNSKETFRLIIEYIEALNIMKGFENWESLTNYLTIEGNDSLVLIIP